MRPGVPAGASRPPLPLASRVLPSCALRSTDLGQARDRWEEGHSTLTLGSRPCSNRRWSAQTSASRRSGERPVERPPGPKSHTLAESEKVVSRHELAFTGEAWTDSARAQNVPISCKTAVAASWPAEPAHMRPRCGRIGRDPSKRADGCSDWTSGACQTPLIVTARGTRAWAHAGGSQRSRMPADESRTRPPRGSSGRTRTAKHLAFAVNKWPNRSGASLMGGQHADLLRIQVPVRSGPAWLH